ncbi:Arm DNA-binding domain-containing protein [Ochrobactrum vermis]|uniref:Arm DNA-binding domain-containing protein n=1 Tax=Ochrobactrum vermis TaxID=1827297 RepID=A0ABU8PD70_9HYPH|nr:Arm DNA-binding domain-containing protein [Ochrobactrum vermis]
MARNKLSETRIRTLTKPGIYSDGDGLYLRVRAGGSRQWVAAVQGAMDDLELHPLAYRNIWNIAQPA